MRLRIEIKTPQGQAKGTAGKLKPFILGRAAVTNQVWANQKDDTIIWVVDTDVRRAMQIERNVALFDKTVRMILGNRMVQGVAKLSPEDRKELNKMLKDQTKIRIIKTYDTMPNLEGWEKEANP
jgi:hypothetical protein